MDFHVLSVVHKFEVTNFHELSKKRTWKIVINLSDSLFSQIFLFKETHENKSFIKIDRFTVHVIIKITNFPN